MSNNIPNLPNINTGQNTQASTDSPADLDNKKTLTFSQSIPNGKQNEVYQILLDKQVLADIIHWQDICLDDAISIQTGLEPVQQNVNLPISFTLVNQHACHIAFLPKLAGEYQMRVHGYHRKRKQQESVLLKAFINPDPKTLWKNIPPDPDALFFKTNEALSIKEDDRVCLTGARVRGRSHAQKGSFCEDDFHVSIINQAPINQSTTNQAPINQPSPDSYYIGVLSDGAGSSEYSRLASKLICDAIPISLTKQINELGLQALLDKVYRVYGQNFKSTQNFKDKESTQDTENIDNTEDNLESLSENSNPQTNIEKVELNKALTGIMGNAVRYALRTLQNYTRLSIQHEEHSQAIKMSDLYGTCLAYWAIPIGDTQHTTWLVVSYWVGDGALVACDDGVYHLLGTPDAGEFSGQTHFLTATQVSDDALAKRIQINCFEHLQAVIAMSDGISDAKFATETVMAQQTPWQTLMQELTPVLPMAKTQPSALYDWLNFWSKGNHDDRSLCVMQIKNQLQKQQLQNQPQKQIK